MISPQVRDDEEDETIATRLTKGQFDPKRVQVVPSPKITVSSTDNAPSTTKKLPMMSAESDERCADSLFLRPSAQFETLPSVKQSFKADGLVSSTPAAAEHGRDQEDEKTEDTQSRLAPRESEESGRKSISQGQIVKNVLP